MTIGEAGARGSLFTVAAEIAGLFVRTAGIVVLARLLTPEIYGLVAIAVGIIALTNSFVHLGLGVATLQAPEASSRARSSLFLINLAMGAIIGGALFLCAGPLALLYDEPSLADLLRWLAIAPLLGGLAGQFRQELIRKLWFGRLALAGLAANATGTGIAIAIAFGGGTFSALLAQTISSAAIELVLVVALAKWIPSFPGNWREEVLPIVRIALNVFGMNTMRNVSNSVIILILGLYAAPTSVGYYDRAQQLILVPISLTVDQLQRVVVPVLSRLRHDTATQVRYLQRFQLVGGYVTSTLFLLLAAMGQPILILILGADWSAAGALVQIMALGATFRASGQAMQWVFISGSTTSTGLRLSLWSQPAIAGVTLAGLPWGVVGVASAGTLAWMAYWPVSVWWAARAIDVPMMSLMSSIFRGVFLFAAPMSLAAASTKFLGLGAAQTVAVGLLAATVTGTVLALTLGPVRNDLAVVAKAVTSALRRV